METQSQPSAGTSAPGAKRTRKRAVMACLECNRRKQKCNRERPCNHCLSRHAPSLCRYALQTAAVKPKPRPKRQRIDDIHSLPKNSLSDHLTGDLHAIDEVSVDRLSASSDLESYDDNGYSSNVLSKLVNEIELPVSAHLESENSLGTAASQSRRATSLPCQDVRALFPRKSVTDFLTNFYLQEANWLYEMIHPLSFLERYESWWSRTEYIDYDDIQFGVLILRVCCNSIVFLPHAKYPTRDLIHDPLEELGQRCHDGADKLDGLHPRKSSCLRIQQLLQKVSYEKSRARMKESWFTLNEAITIAQDLGLHSEKANAEFTPFDVEIRRRLFWSLYIWDKFMVTYLGRWPLIPDGYCTVDFPHDNYFTNVDFEGGPTSYSDQVLHFKLAQLASSILVPEWETQRRDPRAVSEAIQHFQNSYLDSLPPAFKLLNPDTKWDDSIPHLRQKREYLNISIYGTIAGIHRAFLSPSLSRDLDTPSEEINLIEEHQKTLLKSCCSVIRAVNKLHKMLGGGPSRYFCLSTGTIEAGAVLGTCLIAASAKISPQMRQRKSLISPSEIQRGYTTFLEGLTLLGLLAERSVIARRGLKILRDLHSKLQTILDAQSDVDSNVDSVTVGTPLARPNTTTSWVNILEIAQQLTPASDVAWDFQDGQIPSSTSIEFWNGNVTISPDWASFTDSAGPSWFFD